jgi:hypothetical protein
MLEEPRRPLRSCPSVRLFHGFRRGMRTLAGAGFAAAAITTLALIGGECDVQRGERGHLLGLFLRGRSCG